MEGTDDEHAIAIVGIAGRFPGARNVAELWDILKSGREMVSFFSDAELRAAGVDEELLRDPHYVKASVKFDGIEFFDAGFFGYSPSQAAGIDPQQRHFLECAWEALEDCGYDSERYPGSIGIFAGSGVNQYALANLRRAQPTSALDWQQGIIDSDKDYLTTRVSYKLGFNGPSIAVQTACSTSLVAVHLACQSLLSFECDLALAGGAALNLAQEWGYRHIPGGIASSDGHCRAFDADGDGTLAGSGTGVVVLKRLSEALRERDHIYAIVRASVVNNDGSAKVGFTAPGTHGQAQLIATALALADISARDITLIEGHGTATALGDSVELSALREVFGSATADRGFCALGSIKTNIGHLDAAAGVAGLIKAVLCLENRALVPSLNLRKPNPIIASADSPFFVNTRFQPWSSSAERPRYAGVSSFGVGGTNAHVILQEAPDVLREDPTEEEELFVMSARSSRALDSVVANLSTFLGENGNVSAADVAFTLRMGRRRFSHRRFTVARGVADLAAQLQAPAGSEMTLHDAQSVDSPVVFLFPGQGVRYGGMVAGLYATERSFRDNLDHCAQLVAADVGTDIRSVLCERDAPEGLETANARIAQPTLFALEYCLAKLWMDWGVQPAAMIGHSLGEYAAACVAGAFSVEDALSLVVKRAALLSALPAGAMVAVCLDESATQAFLLPGLSLAAINSPVQSVISGPTSQVEECICILRQRGIEHRRLAVSHAFHSDMMEPAMPELTAFASRLRCSLPDIPVMSGVTGRPLTESGIGSPHYWADHLRQPVRFAAALAHTAHTRGTIFLEVGPGDSLANLARQQLPREDNFVFVRSLAEAAGSSRRSMLNTLGTLWLHGARIEADAQRREGRRRIPLPTYPFEKQRHWLLPDTRIARPAPAAVAGARQPPDRWFYIPSWNASLNPHRIPVGLLKSFQWIVLTDVTGFGRDLAADLQAGGADVVTVFAGQRYERLGASCFSVDIDSQMDYRSFMAQLRAEGKTQALRVVHCWSLTDAQIEASAAGFAAAQRRGWTSLVYLMQTARESGMQRDLSLCIVTTGLYCLPGDVAISAAKAPIAAVARVISQECDRVRCTVVDLPRDSGRYVTWLVADAAGQSADRVIAYRGNQRFVQTYLPVNPMPRDHGSAPFVVRGTYLISGGLGEIGLALATWLARKVQARLILLTRTPLPPSRSQVVRDLEADGAEVFVAHADVSDAEQVRAALQNAEARFGAVRGVFHLAGDLRHPSVRKPVDELSYEDLRVQAQPKVHGFYVLDHELADRTLDFAILFSSNASVLGGLGFGAYAAANAFLDHAAIDQWCRGKSRWTAVNWDGWRSLPAHKANDDGSGDWVDSYALTVEEAVDALGRILSFPATPQIVVSAVDLQRRFQTWVSLTGSAAANRVAGDEPHEVISVRTKVAVPPRNNLEQVIAEIWKEVLGVEEISIEDEFLELGGDSLIALRILARLRERFCVEVSPRSLFGRRATVTTLALEVVAALARSQDARVAETEADPVPVE